MTGPRGRACVSAAVVMDGGKAGGATGPLTGGFVDQGGIRNASMVPALGQIEMVCSGGCWCRKRDLFVEVPLVR